MSCLFEVSPLTCEIRYFVKYVVISRNNGMFVIRAQWLLQPANLFPAACTNQHLFIRLPEEIYNADSSWNESEQAVASQLLEISLLSEASCTLQSDGGRDFCNRVLKIFRHHVAKINDYPDTVRVKEVSEILNQGFMRFIITWMRDKHFSKWSGGLQFVKFVTNCTPPRPESSTHLFSLKSVFKCTHWPDVTYTVYGVVVAPPPPLRVFFPHVTRMFVQCNALMLLLFHHVNFFTVLVRDPV